MTSKAQTLMKLRPGETSSIEGVILYRLHTSKYGVYVIERKGGGRVQAKTAMKTVIAAHQAKLI